MEVAAFGGGRFGGYNGTVVYGNGEYGGGGGYNGPGADAILNTGPRRPNAAGAQAGGRVRAILPGTTWASRPAVLVGRGPRVIANPMNNTLLIQATAQEYEGIQQLIPELDVPPRQVLIEAKIYSIDLTHAFSSDVTGALQVDFRIRQHHRLQRLRCSAVSLTWRCASRQPCWWEKAASYSDE